MKLSYDIYLPANNSVRDDLAPVIFLHGRMDSKKTWKDFAPVVAEATRRRVYAIDARNHGDSPWSDEMNFEVLVNDLEEFMVDQNVPKAILIGHSMGGKTALNFALKRPQSVEKLIIEDMNVQDYSPKVKRVVLTVLHLLRSALPAIPKGADETKAKKAVLDYIKDHLPPSNSSKEYKFYDLHTIPLKKNGNSYAWQANLDVLEQMLVSNQCEQNLTGTFTGDSLFLHGTNSYIDVLGDESIRHYFPCASLIGVEGAGHLIHFEYSEEFLKHVLGFIDPKS